MYAPPPQATYQPPQSNFQAPHATYQPAQASYQPVQASYQPPQNSYQPPQNSYQLPPTQVPSYQPSVSQEPAYTHAAGYMPSSQDSNENQNPFGSQSYGGFSQPKQTESSIHTFGTTKAMRSEHNLGEDGSERSSVKVHHPPGGGGSLNFFGGLSEPMYVQPEYKPQSFNAPPSQYQEKSHNQAPSGYSYDQNKSPIGDYSKPVESNYYGDNQNQQMQFSQPPTGFTSSSSYTQPQQIEPTNLNVSSENHVFGQRVESGMNSGPTTDKSSIRVHAPPGGQSNIFF